MKHLYDCDVARPFDCTIVEVKSSCVTMSVYHDIVYLSTEISEYYFLINENEGIQELTNQSKHTQCK